jgi:predicted ester cyclase
MDTEANKLLVRRIIDDVINAGNFDAADEIFAPGYTSNGRTDRGRGPELMKKAAARGRTSFPDLVVTVEDQLADGDKVVTRERWTGTHLGLFAGIPPTGRMVVGTAITIDRIVDGRIVERWSNNNHAEVLRQLRD